jgi:hypothetical protein
MVLLICASSSRQPLFTTSITSTPCTWQWQAVVLLLHTSHVVTQHTEVARCTIGTSVKLAHAVWTEP